MRPTARPIVSLILAAAALSITLDAAAARHRHHRTHRVPHKFVFATPEAAAQASDVGEFAGDFLTGIPGATTADPYARPAYGYDQRGVYGSGYLYPGF